MRDRGTEVARMLWDRWALPIVFQVALNQADPQRARPPI